MDASSHFRSTELQSQIIVCPGTAQAIAAPILYDEMSACHVLSNFVRIYF
jgi:hypothetical protein